MGSLIEKKLIPKLKKINKKLINDKLLNAEELALAATFQSATTETIENFIESEFGVPSPKNKEDIYFKLYENLVFSFEKALIWANSTSTEKHAMGFAEIFGAPEATHEGRTHEQTNRAVGERRRERTTAR